VIALALLSACASPDLVQPLVEARAEVLAADAAEGLRLGMVSGSIGAWICAYDLQDLTELAQVDTGGVAPELTAPLGVAENLAITEAGSYLFNRETGVAQVSFSGSLDAEREVVVEVEVGVPTREFDIAVRDPGDGDWSGSAVVDVEDCAAGPRVSVELDLDDGGTGPRIVLPSPDEDRVEWSPGALVPRSGTASWSEGSGASRRAWTSGEAAEIDGESWPGTGEVVDWEEGVAVDFGRP